MFDKGFSSLPSWRSSAKHEWIIHFSGPFSTLFEKYLTYISLLFGFYVSANSQKDFRLEDFKAPAYPLTRFAVG